MLNLFALLFRQHRRTGQDKLSQSFRMINTMPNCIPKARSILPLVNKTRRITFCQSTDFRLCQHQILIAFFRIPHVKRTFGNLLTCGCLSAPLRTFYDNSPHGLKSLSQNIVCYSFPVITCHAQIVSNYCNQRQQSFGSLDHFHSAVWTNRLVLSQGCGGRQYPFFDNVAKSGMATRIQGRRSVPDRQNKSCATSNLNSHLTDY